MQPQQALEVKKTSPSGPVFVEAEKLFEQVKESAQSIAKRAYEFFEDRGREFGHDLEDWLRAEFELTRRVPLELRENDGQLIVRAEVPGFKPAEIKVSVEPMQIIISGKTEEKKQEETANEVFSEIQSNQFCRCLGLPAEVDPTKATATLKDGVLELMLVKSATGKATNVEIKVA
ncbi:MAG: Hsp20 family protein [Acidobacteria bacterium]|nr:Hsp20 family protein [Acidobacteriota bacterium]